MNHILPCPKCGESEDISCDSYSTMRYTYTYVQCNSCLYMVKTLGNEEEAIELWNEKKRKKNKSAQAK